MDGQVQLLRQPVNDEIDLVELARTLWQQKLLILFCAVAVSAIAALYAFTATPYYRVQSILRPTPIKELDALNQSGVYKLNPDAALQRMGIALESYANRLEFFRTHPDLFVELQQPNLTLEQSFERFNRDAFTVLKPDAKKDTSMGRYVGIAMSYPAGVQGPEALNGLVDYVI
ncbi:Wzz/FepE/Etk N-terminal domain-containing protein, partial [Zestomonas carbonaria]|uniref:Wzz/FepE/Etk N-terminal domain-containing protein n=1 Tax=Zestomonas carbonaria TaxID=2762745 RepID=UPI001F25306E